MLLATQVAGSGRDMPLRVYVGADNARYTCGAPPEGIVFKPTMMFQVNWEKRHAYVSFSASVLDSD